MTTHRGPNPALVSRRAILAGAAAMLAPGQARAQSGPPHRLGWISTEPEPDPFVDGFREGMRRLGYTEGRDFVLELRYAPGNLDRLRAAATELISSRVAFIVASGPAVRAIKTVRDVPVLFVISGDPVALGIAATVARPGGNFTGFTFLSLEIAGKRVELLKQAIPPLRTLVALSNTDHPGEPAERRATEAAAQALGLKVIYVPFGSLAEIDAALAAVRDARPDGMVVFPDGSTMVSRAKIAGFALGQRLPAMFGWSEFSDAGGFMSYGANQRDTYVRLAGYADRLLRGARPADLPIEQPTHFELVLNLRTARLLGITVPPALRLAAHRVIDA